MKRKRRKLAAIICALTLALSSAVPVSACTPPLKPPSVEIPDITFQPDDALKEAISNAAKTGLRNASSVLRQWNMHRTIKASQGILVILMQQSNGQKLKMQRITKCVSQKLTERGKNTIRPIQHFTLPITQMILWQTGWMEQPLK